MLPTIEIFGKTIGMYSVMAMLGLLCCGVVGYFLGKKRGVSFEDMLLIMLVAGGGILVGGHILYGITKFKAIIYTVKNLGDLGFDGFIDAAVYCFGGSVFYGGFIAAALGVFIFSKKLKGVDYHNALDMFAVCVPLFHGFGRIGCFLGGCCYGIESSFGFTAHGNEIVPELNDVSRFPVQLFESAANFGIFILLICLFNKAALHGKLLYVYMSIYPIVRFVLEFFRGDAVRGIWFGLSTSQWVSIGILLFAVIKWISFKKRTKTSDRRRNS